MHVRMSYESFLAFKLGACPYNCQDAFLCASVTKVNIAKH